MGGGERGPGRLTHLPKAELLLDKLFQLLRAQGVLDTLMAGVLVADGHQEANGLIWGVPIAEDWAQSCRQRDRSAAWAARLLTHPHASRPLSSNPFNSL